MTRHCSTKQLSPPHTASAADVSLQELRAMQSMSVCPVDMAWVRRIDAALPRNPKELHSWLRKNIRLRFMTGRIQSPQAVIEERETDCKGYATLAAALGKQLGFPAKGWAVFGRKGAHCFEHVVPVFRVSGRDFIVDAQAEAPGELLAAEVPLCMGRFFALEENGMRGLSLSSGNVWGDIGLSALADFIKTGKFKTPNFDTVKAWVGKQLPAGTQALNAIFPGLGMVGQAFVARVIPPGTFIDSEDQANFLNLIAQAEQLPTGALFKFGGMNVMGSDIKKWRNHIDNEIPTFNQSKLFSRIAESKKNEKENNSPIMREGAKIITKATEARLATLNGSLPAPPVYGQPIPPTQPSPVPIAIDGGNAGNLDVKPKGMSTSTMMMGAAALGIGLWLWSRSRKRVA